MRPAILLIFTARIGCRSQERKCEDAFRALIDGQSIPKPAVLGHARHCIDDGWGDEARECIAAARDVAALEACSAMLTADQREKLEH